jgi:hypothetical protein
MLLGLTNDSTHQCEDDVIVYEASATMTYKALILSELNEGRHEASTGSFALRVRALPLLPDLPPLAKTGIRGRPGFAGPDVRLSRVLWAIGGARYQRGIAEPEPRSTGLSNRPTACLVMPRRPDRMRPWVRWLIERERTTVIRRGDGRRCGRCHWNGWRAYHRRRRDGPDVRQSGRRHPLNGSPRRATSGDRRWPRWQL